METRNLEPHQLCRVCVACPICAGVVFGCGAISLQDGVAAQVKRSCSSNTAPVVAYTETQQRSPATMAHPQLALELLYLLGSGELTASHVQRLAGAALADGWGRNSALAQKLAGAGRSGAYSGNIQRDVLSAARAADLMAQCKPYKVMLPGANQRPFELGIFLPHEIFSSVCSTRGFENYTLSETELALHKTFTCSQRETRDRKTPTALGPFEVIPVFSVTAARQMFCSKKAGTPLGRLLHRWASHQDVCLPQPCTDVAALGVHADGSAYTSNLRAGGQKSVLVGCLNVISGRSEMLRGDRHLMFVVGKSRLCDCGCSGFHTLQGLWDVVAWSMRSLLAGVAPGQRHDGQPFTDYDRDARLAGLVLFF